MRRIAISLSLMISLAVASWGQAVVSAPQTARQALMEMLFSKTPGTFARHLPAITRAALEKSGAMASLQQYSLLMNEMQTQGQSFETFETGSVMLAADNPTTNQKVEIRVENDALRGDDDEIQVSFRVYKNGLAERTPYMPQMTFSMRKEAQTWTLNEISLTVHVPLADPDLLKSFTEKMTAPPSARVTYAAHNETPVQNAGSDSTVLAALRTILTAEVTYAAKYPTVGYTCTLSNLDGFGSGEPNEHQAMLINSGLASGKKYGFIFTLSECTGAPANGFRLTATPNANTFGRKTLCADQTGVIRSSEDANAGTCMASGAPVQ
jgi:hypothetical protein